MTFDPYPEFLTIEQAAAYLGVPEARIRRLLRQHGMGEFLRASMSKTVRIRRSDLDAMHLASQAAAEPETRRRTRQRRGAA